MRRDVVQLANAVGLVVDWYSPGDGITRYRFITTDDEPNYFAARHPLFTALGAKEARLWLCGYAIGAQRQALGEIND